MKRRLNIRLIGHEFMGKSHSHALSDVAMFFDLDAVPVIKVVCCVEDDLEEAGRRGAEEDAKCKKGRGGDELPPWSVRRDSRLAKIGKPKAAPEEEKCASGSAFGGAEDEEARGRKKGGYPPQAPDPEQAKPKPHAPWNFTDLAIQEG